MAVRRDAWFRGEEQRALNAALDEMMGRHTYADDPAAAIAEHAAMGCRWYHAPIGILVHGEGFAPERLVKDLGK